MSQLKLKIMDNIARQKWSEAIDVNVANGTNEQRLDLF
jgi:hypothetical protein